MNRDDERKEIKIEDERRAMRRSEKRNSIGFPI